MQIRQEAKNREDAVEVTEVIEELTEKENIAVNNAMQIIEDDGMKDMKLKKLNKVSEKVKRIAINSLIWNKVNSEGEKYTAEDMH